MKRRRKRPHHLEPPAYLSPSPPAPESEPPQSQEPPAGEDSGRLDPTRYGDWEKKGVAVDF